jgi:hypothetical protein
VEGFCEHGNDRGLHIKTHRLIDVKIGSGAMIYI